MKKNDYDALEDAIGDVGGETTQETKPEKLGKLKKVGKLSDEDKNNMDAFLERSNSHPKVLNLSNLDEDGSPISIGTGWIPMSMEELGERAVFYPEDWQFYIRPASVSVIKNWSAIDESRLENINAVMNDIIKTCVSIKSASGNVNVLRINSWDRFWFILKVREYTFPKGESKVEFEEECPNCDHNILYKLNSQNIRFDMPDEVVVEKHWDSTERTYNIDPTEYGLEGDSIKLYAPTVEKDNMILNYAMEQARAGKKLKESFIKFLPWMISRTSKDEKINTRFIKESQGKFDKWNLDTFAFMEDILRNIAVTPLETLTVTCDDCGEEVTSQMKFPLGIKSLFAIQNKHIKFGTK